MNPQELLLQAAEIIDRRGQDYGGIENNFQLAATLASLRLGREFHPYEIAIVLACVKNARAFTTPNHRDSHIDAMNYEAFAATFADDYVAKSRASASAPELAVVRDHSSDLAFFGQSA